MSLSRHQKCVIREISLFSYSHTERNGTAIIERNGKEEEFVIPSTYEIFNQVISKLHQAGFTKVERCSPQNANCIIRTFQARHQIYDFDCCYNLYGADCFVKERGWWKTATHLDTYPITFDKYKIQLNFLQDESLSINTDFVDYYVKVS